MDSQSGLKLLTTFRNGGEAVQNLQLFSRAWDECVELQSTSRQDWIGRTLLSLQRLDRYEVAAHNGEFTVGGIILAQDLDVHVGPCISVFAQYVLPEFRLQGVSPRLMREAVRLARMGGSPVLAYTHREGPWRYQTVYRRLS